MENEEYKLIEVFTFNNRDCFVSVEKRPEGLGSWISSLHGFGDYGKKSYYYHGGFYCLLSEPNKKIRDEGLIELLDKFRKERRVRYQ